MKIVVLGAGSAGSRHLNALRSLKAVEPVAVPCRASRLNELDHHGFTTAPDIQAAVSYGARAAIVATETRRHVEDALSALDAGLRVLVEKPVAVDSVEACRLRDRASQLGHKVYVGCVLRFSESLNTFREFVKEIGKPHSVRIECQSYLPDWRPSRLYRESYSARGNEGGVLRDLIHEIDYAGWIFGWPTSVQGRVRNLGRLGIEAEEAAELWWETPGGCAVSVSLDYLTRPSRRRMRVAGELGMVEWDGIEGRTTLALPDAPARVIRSSQTLDDLFLGQVRAFVAASQGTQDPRLATVDEGIKALAVCDAARLASERRREEPVHYR